ncbi:MAG: hypothetical protein ACYTE5_10395 [Planctomycetota bacterium]|jgi:hypothetical protein
MKWFKITMSRAEVEGGEPGALRDQFIELYMASDDPTNMALFTNDSAPNEFYLCCSRHSIPYLRILTDSYESPPCDKPKHQKLILLAGDASHLDKLLRSSF